jgi:hypothetical protein
MGVLLAVFDNATKAVDVLQNIKGTQFEGLVSRDKKIRLLAFSKSDAEIDQLRTGFPNIQAVKTHRLLDSDEGGARGALLGIVSGAVLIQLVGWALYYALPQPLEQGSGINIGTQGALIALFMGFFGAVLGGVAGFVSGRKWIGLPPEIARRYEYRLERGELVLAINKRQLLLDSPRRIRIETARPEGFSLERFYYWLGEHGAYDTRRVNGSVAALVVVPGQENRALFSPWYYNEEEDESERRL